MKSFSFREFKPTILFLVKFVGLYLAGNLLYGFYITAFEPRPDPVTHWVSGHTAFLLSTCGWPVTLYDHADKPTTLLLYEGQSVLSVYEGCNGMNTMIIFLSFLVAFGPINRNWWWFTPLGILIIHLMNLVRITLLFIVAEYLPDFMYITHKYFFTAFLYGVIFLLWLWWVKKFSLSGKET